jgi:glycine/D-amino acid oxidase-like deaminating enzyme
VKILVAYPMAADAVRLLGRHAASYRPDVGCPDGPGFGPAIDACRPDVILAERAPDPTEREAWRRLRPGASLFVVLKGGEEADDDLGVPLPPAMSIHRVHPLGPSADLDVLRAAESIYNRHVTCAAARATVEARRGSRTGAAESVLVVGAGIVGVVTALRLVRAGFRVQLVDACPDPRSAGDWRSFGCTRAGGNARMFTLTEADNYNDQDGSGAASQLFRSTVSECGWRICGEETLGRDERAWVDVHERLPPWQARVFNQDIFSFNEEGRILWEELRNVMPGLFDEVELRDGILRLYTDPAHLEASAARQVAVGALRERLEPGAIRARFPALADPCGSGLIAGGLDVVGFTVNVHDFVAKILTFLEGAGVVMSWNERVLGISREAGSVESLVTETGPLRADHYVLSPGVYGQEMLAGTASATQIQGVLGVWMTLPNLEPKLQNSLKIARKGHMAEDANVTVARNAAGDDVLEYGSGYGYTGLRADNILPEQLQALYDAVEENVEAFFPRAHAAAVESGLILSSRKLCVRPWTPTGLGVFEIVPATSGLLVIVGGHNTGGFAQSPAVAHAVLSALRGSVHPMHELYHPARAGQIFATREASADPPLRVLAAAMAAPSALGDTDAPTPRR